MPRVSAKLHSQLKPELKMISETTALKVPFFDVDSLNIVWHGNYPKYFEIARCALLDKIGYNYEDMRRTGFSFPVVDMQIKYVKPLLFNQEILIKATLVEWDFRLKIKYLIEDSTSGERLTKGHTCQAAVDMKKMEMRLECPRHFIDKVEAMLAS